MDQLARSIDPNDLMSGLPTEMMKQNINFFFRTRTFEVLPYLPHHACIAYLRPLVN